MELMHPSKVQLIYDETIWTTTQYNGQPIERTTKHDFVNENGGKWVELERIYHLACVANEIIRFHNRLVENDIRYPIGFDNLERFLPNRKEILKDTQKALEEISAELEGLYNARRYN